MKKVLSIFLASIMLVSTAACSNSEIGSKSDGNNAAAVTETTAETIDYSLRENTPDSLPAGLNFDGEVMNVLVLGSEESIDWIAEDTGDLVASAVVKRRSDVGERLNVGFKMTYVSDADWQNVTRNSILANDNSFDYSSASQWRAAPLVAEGMFLDMQNANYIDYSKPWWNNNYMDEAAINGSRYMLVGDVLLSTLMNMSCIYFNKQYFETIIGENSDIMYEIVQNGEWTLEKFSSLCVGAYRDLNGDSTMDDGDAYGTGVITSNLTDHFAFDSGIRYTSRNADGIPQLDMNNERTVKLTETLYKLYYENEGVRVFPPTGEAVGITIPNKFKNNEIVFLPGWLYTADALRDMEADYGIIPYPKLDEQVDNYASLVHDSASVISVPITCQKLDTVCAVLEATAAENYRVVTPTYYDVALKNKYIRDDISGQILDLIHDSGTTDFAYIYNYAMGNIGTIMRTMMGNKRADFVSIYTKFESPAIEGMETVINAIIENSSNQ